MTAEHWIEWVSLKTDKGIQRKYLKPGEKPSVDFKILEDEKVEEVYAYCNLHGLWKNNGAIKRPEMVFLYVLY